MQEVSKGTEFLGMVVYPGRIVPGKRIVRNYQRALFGYEMGMKDEDSIVSYMGLLKHVDGTRTQKRLFGNAGFEYNW